MGTERVMQLIDAIDWSGLHYTYGPATVSAAHLRTLTCADTDAWKAALDHLDSEVMHQGYPHSADAAITRVVAMMLSEEAAVPAARPYLVEFLGYMAVGTRNAEKNDYFAALLPSLEEAMQQSYPAVMKFLDEPALSMRRTAIDAAISHVWTRGLAHHRPMLVSRLKRWARARSEERVYWVENLAELGEDTEEFLADENAQVQVVAALSPALADNAVATEIIIDALSQAAERGIAEPQIYSLSALVCAAIARIDDLQRIAVPVVTIARNESWTGFDDRYGTWGPLMRAIFQPPYSAEAKLTPLQRDFLAALLENAQIWNDRNGSIGLLFMQTGLSFDREICAHIIEENYA